MSDEPFFSGQPRPLPLAGDADPHDSDLPLLYQTSYCSRAVGGVDDSAVDRIIASAHPHNPAHGTTGLRVFGSGVFFNGSKARGRMCRH